MRSFRLKILLISVCALFLAAPAFALPMAGDTVLMGTADGGGVPYTMEIKTSADDESIGKVWETFCLEKGKFFTPGVTYEVESVEDFATGGGGGAESDGNGGTLDPLSDATKWLYAAWFSPGGLNVSAQTVQNAIWYLEGEDNSLESAWTGVLETAYGESGGFSGTGWNVKAVNLTLDGEDKQSQLVGEKTSVPEPATMFLLGTGLLGIAVASRKKFLK